MACLEALERRCDLLAVAGPIDRIARDHSCDERVEPERDLGPELAHAWNAREKDLREQRERPRALERAPPREALEQDAAEGEHVARVRRPPDRPRACSGAR